MKEKYFKHSKNSIKWEILFFIRVWASQALLNFGSGTLVPSKADESNTEKLLKQCQVLLSISINLQLCYDRSTGHLICSCTDEHSPCSNDLVSWKEIHYCTQTVHCLELPPRADILSDHWLARRKIQSPPCELTTSVLSALRILHPLAGTDCWGRQTGSSHCLSFCSAAYNVVYELKTQTAKECLCWHFKISSWAKLSWVKLSKRSNLSLFSKAQSLKARFLENGLVQVA